MKKLPPRNSWRARYGRGWPTTEEMATSPVSTGMWHAWQLFSFT